jgi:anti-anti-sigma factor
VPDLVISVSVLPAGDGICCVVRLAGEADITSTELRDALTAELAGGPRRLLVDMSGLTFMDSGATQMIIAAYRVALHGGGTLALVRPSAPVARMLELMEVTTLINVYDSVDDAITDTSQGEP